MGFRVLVAAEAGGELEFLVETAADLDGAHAVNAPRSSSTERAPAWAFEQVGRRDAAVSRTAEQLGVAWWTVMGQVTERGTPGVDEPAGSTRSMGR